MRRYSADPNNSDNPASPYYEPKYTYEFHVIHRGGPLFKPTQKPEEYALNPQPNMGYAVIGMDFSVPETFFPTPVLPNTLEMATLTMTFKGTAKSKILMTQTFFNANQKNIKIGFQADVDNWLKQFKYVLAINQSSPELSGAKITEGLDDEFNSTQTSASTEEISRGSYENFGNKVESKNSATLSRGDSIDVSAGSNIDGNNSSLSWSSTKPTTITFTFAPKSVSGQYGKTNFEGELEAKLQVTLYPIIQIPAEGESPQIQTANQTNTLLVSIAVGSGITAAILTFPNLLKWVLQPASAY